MILLRSEPANVPNIICYHNDGKYFTGRKAGRPFLVANSPERWRLFDYPAKVPLYIQRFGWGALWDRCGSRFLFDGGKGGQLMRNL